MQGYDLDLAERVSAIVDTPLTIMGGAGTLQDMNELIDIIKQQQQQLKQRATTTNESTTTNGQQQQQLQLTQQLKEQTQ